MRLVRPFVFIAAALAALDSGCTSPGLVRREESIQASLLRLTPLGSSIEHVEYVAKKEGWTDVAVSRTRGFFDNTPLAERTVGVASVRAHIGKYPWFPLGTTWVTASWGFDSNGRLIEIAVQKSVDTL